MAAVVYRPLRVAGLLKREITTLMHNKINDPRLNQIVITEVEVSKGCAHAKVYIVVPERKNEAQILKAIAKASGFIRSNLSSNLELRFVPKLTFKIDNSYKQGNRIDQILNRLATQNSDESMTEE